MHSDSRSLPFSTLALPLRTLLAHLLFLLSLTLPQLLLSHTFIDPRLPLLKYTCQLNESYIGLLPHVVIAMLVILRELVHGHFQIS